MLSASLNKTSPSFLRRMLALIVLYLFESLPWFYGAQRSERERNVLFNDALNTFYLRLYGVRHMVKDHSDSEKGNPLPPHRLLLSINSKGSFICTIPQTGYHIPRPLLHQSWSTGWNEKYAKKRLVLQQCYFSEVIGIFNLAFVDRWVSICDRHTGNTWALIAVIDGQHLS